MSHSVSPISHIKREPSKVALVLNGLREAKHKVKAGSFIGYSFTCSILVMTVY